MMVSLKSFVLQHPKIVVGVTVLAIVLLANPTMATITETGFPAL